LATAHSALATAFAEVEVPAKVDRETYVRQATCAHRRIRQLPDGTDASTKRASQINYQSP
jgi:hypothetical protein